MYPDHLTGQDCRSQEGIMFMCVPENNNIFG